jgi:hypothetical protein
MGPLGRCLSGLDHSAVGPRPPLLQNADKGSTKLYVENHSSTVIGNTFRYVTSLTGWCVVGFQPHAGWQGGSLALISLAHG